MEMNFLKKSQSFPAVIVLRWLTVTYFVAKQPE